MTSPAGPDGGLTSSARRPGRAGRPIRIGITGPIGCGKSTVTGWLGELGAVVIDADIVARRVTAPGTPALASIASGFGPDVLGDDGSLDRVALGRVVFADPEALRRLEAIVHPAVRPVILEEMAAAERDGAPAVVIEAIKLVEGGLAQLCDEVWLVSCDPTVQRERLLARTLALGGAEASDRTGPGDATAGATRADTADRAQTDARAAAHLEARQDGDVDARIAAQADLAARLRPHATRVIDTTGSIADSRSRVTAAWSAAQARHSG